MSNRINENFLERVHQCAQEYEVEGNFIGIMDLMATARDNGIELKPCKDCELFNCECNTACGDCKKVDCMCYETHLELA